VASELQKLEISAEQFEMEEKPFAGGGFGKVYKAKWGEKVVVIKAIKTEIGETKYDVWHEADIILRLKHNNIVELFGIMRLQSDQFGIVMELAEHGSLDEWIGKIDQDKTKMIALGVLDGLEYCHSKHVIHRDIKPPNILMLGPEDDMIPKIADFGVSKVIETATATHTQVGERLYMAPEVMMYRRYSFSADIFSLTIMLFEMFNEQLLRNSPVEVQHFIQRVHSGATDDIPKTCNVPKYLHSVIRRGWEQIPAQRPSLGDYRSALTG